MSVKLLTEHYLEFLSLKGGCTDFFESTHVKMPHRWKSHGTFQLMLLLYDIASWSVITHVLKLMSH